MLYLSSGPERSIRACNQNYFPNGVYHPEQWLEEYDLLYIRNGEWHVCEDDRVYPVRGGQLIILEPHRHLSSTDLCTPGMKNLFIHCSRLPEDRAAEDEEEEINPEKYFRLNKITDCSGNLKIEQMFLQIIEAFRSDEPHTARTVSAMLTLLLAEIEKTGRSGKARDPLVYEIIHCFNLQTDRFFSPRELADRYDISIRSLSGRFRAVTGMPVHRYQMKLKLEIARELLHSGSGLSIRDLALGLGFYDEFQFSRLFKRQFGVSPSAERPDRTISAPGKK